MAWRRTLLCLAALVGGFGAVAPSALACTCRAEPVMPPDITNFDHVVLGLVVDRDDDMRVPTATPMASYRVLILASFRGARVGETLTVRSPANEAACGLPMRAGDWWLLYVHDGRPLGLCGPHGRAEARQDVLRRLWAAPR